MSPSEYPPEVVSIDSPSIEDDRTIQATIIQGVLGFIDQVGDQIQPGSPTLVARVDGLTHETWDRRKRLLFLPLNPNLNPPGDNRPYAVTQVIDPKEIGSVGLRLTVSGYLARIQNLARGIA